MTRTVLPMERFASESPTLYGRPFIRPALHTFEVFYSMDEGSRRIPGVDVVALVMSFEQDDETVIDRAIDEIIDQEVDAHARRHAEIGGKM